MLGSHSNPVSAKLVREKTIAAAIRALCASHAVPTKPRSGASEQGAAAYGSLS
jgi:hypothetical protein